MKRSLSPSCHIVNEAVLKALRDGSLDLQEVFGPECSKECVDEYMRPTPLRRILDCEAKLHAEKQRTERSLARIRVQAARTAQQIEEEMDRIRQLIREGAIPVVDLTTDEELPPDFPTVEVTMERSPSTASTVLYEEPTEEELAALTREQREEFDRLERLENEVLEWRLSLGLRDDA